MSSCCYDGLGETQDFPIEPIEVPTADQIRAAMDELEADGCIPIDVYIRPQIPVEDIQLDVSLMGNIEQCKFGELEVLEELTEYIKSTYSQHYTNQYDDLQSIDVWAAHGTVVGTCLDTANKYYMRFGKKGGKNPKDLLKMLHYTVLAYHFAINNDEYEGN